MAFLVTALIIATRRHSESGNGSSARMASLEVEVQRLAAIVSVAHDQRRFYANALESVSDNDHLRKNLQERYQLVERMLSELNRQITAQGGENYAAPHLLVQRDEYKDEQRLLEMKLDSKLDLGGL